VTLPSITTKRCEVILPWPPSALNPNARLHWSKIAMAKKAYREACFYEARSAGITAAIFPRDKKLHVNLLFYPPDRRHRDQDNMLAAMKSGLDGLASAMGIDDRHFKMTFDVASTIGGMVKVTIHE